MYVLASANKMRKKSTRFLRVLNFYYLIMLISRIVMTMIVILNIRIMLLRSLSYLLF